jgi:hypothetical protein
MSNEHMIAAAKASAQLIIPEIANEHYVAEEGITNETMQFGALNRIAEATLALAYEQRTANLLALHAALDKRREYRKALDVLRVIDERLGLA